jgi:hypothetical protein
MWPWRKREKETSRRTGSPDPVLPQSVMLDGGAASVAGVASMTPPSVPACDVVAPSFDGSSCGFDGGGGGGGGGDGGG